MTWLAVAVGTSGASGATGSSGATGFTGSTGSSGATGATGSSGTTGATGTAGATGATGSPANVVTPITLLSCGCRNNAAFIKRILTITAPINIRFRWLVVTGFPVLTVSPMQLSFTAQSSQAPQTEFIQIGTVGTSASGFTIASSAPWLTAVAQQMTTPATISVSVDSAGLAAGTYTGTLNVQPASSDQYSIPIAVTFTVTGTNSSYIVAGPPELVFSYQLGQSTPATEFVQLTSPSGAAANVTTTTSTLSSTNCLQGNWITVQPVNASSTGASTTPTTLAASINPQGMQPGVCTGTITVSYNFAASGATGAPVATGATGTSGASGASGASGTNGTSGASGTSGTSGATGVSGATGTSGVTGTSGSTGASGATGISGSTGASGTTGATASSGAPGTAHGVITIPVIAVISNSPLLSINLPLGFGTETCGFQGRRDLEGPGLPVCRELREPLGLLARSEPLRHRLACWRLRPRSSSTKPLASWADGSMGTTGTSERMPSIMREIVISSTDNVTPLSFTATARFFRGNTCLYRSQLRVPDTRGGDGIDRPRGLDQRRLQRIHHHRSGTISTQYCRPRKRYPSPFPFNCRGAGAPAPLRARQALRQDSPKNSGSSTSCRKTAQSQ